MAIYHLCVKAIQRSKGQSATAGAAYRSADKIKDKRTCELHDYTKKQGIIYTEIVAPNEQKTERSALWNMAELAEKRKDGTTAKEYEVSLPAELSANERQSLALEFAKYLVERHHCVADICLHEPNKYGDQRNCHAHILCTTRIFKEGKLTSKCDVELSDRDRKKKGLGGRKAELDHSRKAWEQMLNIALERANVQERVSCLSLAEQGIEREPQQHMGKSATAIERKGLKPRRTRVKDIVETPKKEVKEEVQEVKNTKKELLKEVKQDEEYTKKAWEQRMYCEEKWNNDQKFLDNVKLVSRWKQEEIICKANVDFNFAKNKLDGFENNVKNMGFLAKTAKKSQIESERRDLLEKLNSAEKKRKQCYTEKEKDGINYSKSEKIRIERQELWEKSQEYKDLKNRQKERTIQMRKLKNEKRLEPQEKVQSKGMHIGF